MNISPVEGKSSPVAYTGTFEKFGPMINQIVVGITIRSSKLIKYLVLLKQFHSYQRAESSKYPEDFPKTSED